MITNMDADLFGHQLIGLLLLFGVAAYILVLKWLNLRRYQIKLELIHKERLVAMEKGIPTPEVADYENGSRARWETIASYLRVNPKWPLGAGILLVFGGAGTLIALRLSGDPYHQQIWPFGLIPIFAGVGLWLQYLVMRPRDGR